MRGYVWAIWLAAPAVSAAPLAVVNAGFEDTSGQAVFNEFTFGTPAGWSLYDPSNIVPSAGIFVGTLQPDGVEFFDGPAPEGTRAILFGNGEFGAGEYGFEQTLGDTLQANTHYALSVEVGNIASGTASNGTFFNLDEFPGYRVDLLAGGVVIASDNSALFGAIPEGQWATSTVSLTIGAAHAQLGQTLGIRVVNLNMIPAGYSALTSPDLEVDFDLVRIDASPVPLPAAAWLFVSSIGLLGTVARRHAR